MASELEEVLRREFGEQESPDNPSSASGPLTLTDLGNGRRMLLKHGHKLHFTRKSRQWYVWDGRLWNPNADDLLHRLAEETVRGIYIEVGNEKDSARRADLARHAKASESAYRINAMLTVLKDMNDLSRCISISIDDEHFDANPQYFNLGNGIYDLQEHRLLDHEHPELLLSRISPVD